MRTDITRTPHGIEQTVDQTGINSLLCAGSIILTLITIAILAVPLGLHTFVMPQFLEVYEDFDTELPWITIRIVTTPLYMALVFYFGITALLITKEFIPLINHRTRIVISTVALLFAIPVPFIYFAGLWLPHMSLMESLM